MNCRPIAYTFAAPTEKINGGKYVKGCLGSLYYDTTTFPWIH
jgi:hypothetical protein